MLCNTLKDVKAEAEYLICWTDIWWDNCGMSSLDESILKFISRLLRLRYLGEEIPVVVDHKMGETPAAEVLLRNNTKRILHFRSTAEKSLYIMIVMQNFKNYGWAGIETYCYDLDWRRWDQYYHQVAEEVMEKSEIWWCLV